MWATFPVATQAPLQYVYTRRLSAQAAVPRAWGFDVWREALTACTRPRESALSQHRWRSGGCTSQLPPPSLRITL